MSLEQLGLFVQCGMNSCDVWRESMSVMCDVCLPLLQISQSQNRVFLNADTLMLNLKDMEV